MSQFLSDLPLPWSTSLADDEEGQDALSPLNSNIKGVCTPDLRLDPSLRAIFRNKEVYLLFVILVFIQRSASRIIINSGSLKNF